MITSLYAGLLGLLYFKISVETIRSRQRNQVSLGSGDCEELDQLARAHDNFNAYIPLLLSMIFLVEYSGKVHPAIIHAFASISLVGRYFHFIAFRKKMNFKKRKLGMYMTLWPLLLLSLLNVYVYLKKFF